jgi:PB1 domain
MPLHFKLKFGTETRRCSFPEPPSWDALATKLHAVFGLPKDTIAVSYLDAEDDEITLSSEEELQDYYLIVPSPDVPDQTIKLNLVDLSSRRERNAARSPKIPLTVFELDEAWQPLPPFHSGPSAIITSDTIPSSFSHAFVEVLDTDPSVTNLPLRGSDNSSTTSTPQPSSGKGKGRLGAPTPSRGTSTQSILDDDAPDKHEIHVMDRSLSADDHLK